MYCSHCGSERLRLSRLRLSDLPRLLLFLYPVRCAACFDRAFVSLSAAFKIRRDASARKRAAGQSRSAAPHTKTNGA